MHRRQQFSVFDSHLDLAHQFWEKLLLPTDTAVDATCGNGHDTLELVKILSQGKVLSLDIQKEALEAAQMLLSAEEKERVLFYHQSHVEFPEENRVKLIIYNLGYLPGKNKSITTMTETTLLSVKKALALATGGVSITCYPGHPEGEKEEKALLSLCSTLDPKVFSASYTRWVNRETSPSLIFIQKHIK